MPNKPTLTPNDTSKPLGHKNPPKETQFKKGNPGGPGRPKGVSSAEGALKKLFRDRLELTSRNGKFTKPVSDVVIKRAQKMLTSGSDASFFRLLELYKEYGPEEEVSKTERVGNLEQLGMEFMSLYVCIMKRTYAYLDHEEGEPIEPLDPKYVAPVLGLWEFFIGKDGHIDFRRPTEAGELDPYLDN